MCGCEDKIVFENKVKEVKVFCEQCKKVIPVSVPYSVVENRLGSLSRYVFVHGFPIHKLVLYIDAYFKVKEVKVFSTSFSKEKMKRSIESIKTGISKGKVVTSISGFVDMEVFLKFFQTRKHNGYIFAVSHGEESIEIGVIILMNGILEVVFWKEEENRILGKKALAKFYETENFETIYVYELTEEAVAELIENREIWH